MAQSKRLLRITGMCVCDLWLITRGSETAQNYDENDTLYGYVSFWCSLGKVSRPRTLSPVPWGCAFSLQARVWCPLSVDKTKPNEHGVVEWSRTLRSVLRKGKVFWGSKDGGGGAGRSTAGLRTAELLVTS